jgi:hypothetical protein
MMNHSLTRLRRGIAIAVAFAALAAPTALAIPGTSVPDDLWLNSSANAQPADPWFVNYVASHAADSSFVTDTLAPGGGSSETQGYRFTSDTLAPGGGSVSAAPATPGFDWDDAGIGAGTTFGVVLILLAGTQLLLVRRRKFAL